MPRLLVDATTLSTNSKGVGRYASHMIRELTRNLDGDWTMVTMLAEHGYPNLPDTVKIRRVDVPRLPSFVHGLVTVPIVRLATRCDYI